MLVRRSDSIDAAEALGLVSVRSTLALRAAC